MRSAALSAEAGAHFDFHFELVADYPGLYAVDLRGSGFALEETTVASELVADDFVEVHAHDHVDPALEIEAEFHCGRGIQAGIFPSPSGCLRLQMVGVMSQR